MSTEPVDGVIARRDCLVLFTNYFPYHRGEEYLETELPYLVERFERVVIVPVMFESRMPLTRGLPDGVVVVPVDMPSSRPARAWHVVINTGGVVRAGLVADTARPWRPLRVPLRLVLHHPRVGVLEAGTDRDPHRCG